jgi:hypothetical protein
MSIVLLGSTSGSCTLQEQAVAGTTTLTLPTFNGTVGLLVSGTAVASTSGTSIDFTSIPAGVRRITVMLSGVSTNGTSNLLIQLGDSGGIENTGYGSSCAYTGTATNGSTSTIGFLTTLDGSGASAFGGNIVLCLISGTTWVSSGTFIYNVSSPSNFVGVSGGAKTLSATLDRIRITTVNGTDTFDAGSINILYE